MTEDVPLEVDAFLRWAWAQGPKAPGTSPCTLDDLCFELGGAVTLEELRLLYECLALRVRRNQRQGWALWEGIR